METSLDKTAIFKSIGNVVEKSFDILREASLNEKFIELQAIIASLIVISIMYQGYLTMAGKQQDPIRELVWDIARKMFILCFVLNINGWLDSSINALSAIYEWAGGGSVFYEKLDNLTNAFFEAIEKVWGKHNGLDAIIGCFICLFMLIAFLAIILTFAFSIIKTSITNTLLIIVLPLALMCFMYQSTKQIFQQWLQMFFSNIILLILLTNFIDFVCGNLTNLYSPQNESENVFIMILFPVLISAILITIVGTIQSVASNLAQVSLEGSTGMSKTMGMMGAGAGMATKSGFNMGKGVFRKSASNALEKDGVSGAIGYGLKKGAGGIVGGAGWAAKKLWQKMRN